MAVSLLTATKRWQGLSTDEKPSTNVPEGSTFHAIDTGEEYVYHDGSWEQDLRRIAALQAV